MSETGEHHNDFRIWPMEASTHSVAKIKVGVTLYNGTSSQRSFAMAEGVDPLMYNLFERLVGEMQYTVRDPYMPTNAEVTGLTWVLGDLDDGGRQTAAARIDSVWSILSARPRPTQTVETQTVEAQTAGTQTARTQTAGTQTAGTQTAGTQTAGTQMAGTQTDGTQTDMPP
ncbi:MAG: hypothetical protein Q9183_003773 [Haloplaca sp. 2 TL-2023]